MIHGKMSGALGYLRLLTFFCCDSCAGLLRLGIGSEFCKTFCKERV